MAKFLDTSGISHELTEIIKNATDRLILISPYLKFNRLLKEQLQDRDKLKIDIRVIYGKSDLHPKESEWLAGTEIRTSFREHLHAKCYMNDTRALITSMNLYEFSQQNNDEMGILVSREDDPELYQKIKEDVDRILRGSESVKLGVTRIEDDDIPMLKPDEPARRQSSSDRRRTELPEFGFCLRCGTEIPCDAERPYCNSDYRSWARYKNASFEEKHCHTCGNDHSSSMAKPLCLTCFRKYGSALRAAG